MCARTLTHARTRMHTHTMQARIYVYVRAHSYALTHNLQAEKQCANDTRVDSRRGRKAKEKDREGGIEL